MHGAAAPKRRGALGLGLLLAAFTGIAIWQVTLIPEPPGYTPVGATAMPAAVAAVLAVLVLAYLVASWRGRSPDALHDEVEGPLPGRVARSAWMVAGLAALVLLTPGFGIGAAGVPAFALIARAFDSRRWLRDLLVGFVLGLAVYLFFVGFLNVNLPAGLLAPVLGTAGL